MTVLAVSLACAAAGAAAAQPAATPPVLAGGNQDTDVAQIDDFRDHDAAAGRAYLAGTAITSREGSWTVGLRQPTAPIGALSMSYSLDDRVELGVGFAYVADDGGNDAPVAPSLSVKVQVARTRDLALALETGYYHTPDEGMTYLSAIGSACLSSRGCAVLASAHVSAILVPSDERGARDTVILGGGSILAGGRSVRLLAEVEVLPLDPDERAVTAMAGVRFASAHASLDLGGGMVTATDEDTVAIPALLLAGSLRY